MCHIYQCLQFGGPETNRMRSLSSSTKNFPVRREILMPVASGASVDDIFFGQLCQFYRLALSLCGDKLTAEQTLIDAYERVTSADHVQPCSHIRWVKHYLIRAPLDPNSPLRPDHTA